jgi:hypothetical protein
MGKSLALVLQANATAHKLKIKCRAVVMPPSRADVIRYRSRPRCYSRGGGSLDA